MCQAHGNECFSDSIWRKHSSFVSYLPSVVDLKAECVRHCRDRKLVKKFQAKVRCGVVGERSYAKTGQRPHVDHKAGDRGKFVTIACEESGVFEEAASCRIWSVWRTLWEGLS